MIPREDFERVINKVRYRVRDATPLAHNHYWNGRSYERNFRNTWLYRSKNGRYFAVHLTMWQGELDYIEPLTEGDAYSLYEKLPVKEMPVEKAFPQYKIRDA